MIERLIIRLASKASKKNHWLIWSDSDNKAIESGELENAQQLSLLTEKAHKRSVICLLPGADVPIRKIPIDGPFNRQMQQALPYLVEEELASDVETLHFSVMAKEPNLLYVAVCEKHKVKMWLSWLEAAHITCKQFIPEGLALPMGTDHNWHAVLLAEQWIVREDQNIAWSCEQDMLELVLASKIADDTNLNIESHTPSLKNMLAQWIELPPIPAMELLAKGTKNNKLNILTGDFKPFKENNILLEKWRIPFILAGILLVVVMLNQYRENTKLEEQTLQVKRQTEAVYQQAFPAQSRLKYPRIRKKLKSMLVGLEGNVDSGFLSMLDGLVPAFIQSPQLEISNLKFDSKKKELRVFANADNFLSFDKFSEALAEGFEVDQGALSSSKGRVSGLLTIRIK